MTWTLSLVGGLVSAVVVPRLLGARFDLGHKLLLAVVSVAAAAALASQLSRLDALDATMAVLIGSVLVSAAGAVSFEVGSVPEGGDHRSWVLKILLLPSAVRQRISRARRYSQIMTIATRHGFAAYLDIARPLPDPPRGRRLGRSLRMALEECGGVFVKFGQVLSQRTDILPTPVIDELRRLQEQVTEEPPESISQALSRHLGQDISSAFDSFEPRPVAAGSIAQVHRARLHDGRAVAVKVQRPGIAALVERDLRIIQRLAKMTDRAWESGRRMRVSDLAAGFAEAMREEFDFRIEARNAAVMAERVGAVSGATVPRVIAELSGPSVLVSEWVDGVSVGRARELLATSALDGHSLAQNLLASLLHQILIEGIFHADPHPGNVFVSARGTLTFLDLGSVARIDARQQSAVRRVLYAVARRDPRVMTDAVLDLAEAADSTDELRLYRAIAQFMTHRLGAGMPADVTLFTALFRLLVDHGLAFPPDLGAVFRSLITLQGSLAALDPTFNIVEEARLAAGSLLRDAAEPAGLVHALEEDLMALVPVLRRVPRRIDRIGAAVESGRLVLNVRLFSDARDNDFVRRLADRAVLAVLLAADGFVSVQMVSSTAGPRLSMGVSVLQASGYLGLVGGFVLLMRLLLALLRDRSI